MNSFFLSETCKYLYLLFEENHWLHNTSLDLDGSNNHLTNQPRTTEYIFTTEGHLFPIRRDIQKRFGDESKWGRQVTDPNNQTISPSMNHATCPFIDLALWYPAHNEFYQQAHDMQLKADEIHDQCDASQQPQPMNKQATNQIAELHKLNPNQLQEMIERALKQQQFAPNIQQINPLLNQQVNQPVHQAGDFVIRTGAGVFLIDRISTGESLEARSLGGPVVELLDVYPDPTAVHSKPAEPLTDDLIDNEKPIEQHSHTIIHSAIITPKGGFEYFVEVISSNSHVEQHAEHQSIDQSIHASADDQSLDSISSMSHNHSIDDVLAQSVEPFASTSTNVSHVEHSDHSISEADHHKADKTANPAIIRAAGAYFGAASPPGIYYHWINHQPHVAVDEQHINDPIDDVLELVTGEIVNSFTPLSCPNDQSVEQSDNPSRYSGKIVLIDRGICTFVEKVWIAQNAGAKGVLIVNQATDGQFNRLFTLGYGTEDKEPHIPAFMIGRDDGAKLRQLLRTNDQSINSRVRLMRQRIDQEPINESIYDKMHVSGNPSLLTIRAIGGAIIEIEEGQGKTFQLRIKEQA